jgi:hypothetical protein
VGSIFFTKEITMKTIGTIERMMLKHVRAIESAATTGGTDAAWSRARAEIAALDDEDKDTHIMVVMTILMRLAAHVALTQIAPEMMEHTPAIQGLKLERRGLPIQ